jgi:hypothetical protein
MVTMRSRPKARPPCGGAPYFSASSRKPNLSLRLFRADVERLENLLLDLGAVDTHRAAAQFPAVQRQVVGLGQALARVGLSRSRCSSFGLVKGWWQAVQRLFSSS